MILSWTFGAGIGLLTIGVEVCVGGAVVVGILCAILNIRIAANVTDGDVKAVAYVGAVIGGVAAFGWVLFGVSELIHYRSTLRKAEAD